MGTAPFVLRKPYLTNLICNPLKATARLYAVGDARWSPAREGCSEVESQTLTMQRKVQVADVLSKYRRFDRL